MVWLWRDPERDKQTTDEIDRQEDRGAAIVAVAYFEDFLTASIKTQLIKDEEVTDPLFKGRGQLADFCHQNRLRIFAWANKQAAVASPPDRAPN